MTLRGLLASIIERFCFRSATNVQGGNLAAAISEVLTLGATAELSDAIKEHIPVYLTLEQKQALASAFERVPDAKEYYLSGLYADEMLQGDCWTNLQVFNFETGEKKKVRGVILSNSCDISPENRREIGPNIVFSPVIKLSKYVQLLKQSGMDPERVEAKLQAIRNQAVTAIFYLPDAIGGLGDEYVVVLDNIHTIPAHVIKIGAENVKGFTLNNLGFYMFIFKLSINFCRLRENVLRAAS